MKSVHLVIGVGRSDSPAARARSLDKPLLMPERYTTTGSSRGPHSNDNSPSLSKDVNNGDTELHSWTRLLVGTRYADMAGCEFGSQWAIFRKFSGSNARPLFCSPICSSHDAKLPFMMVLNPRGTGNNRYGRSCLRQSAFLTTSPTYFR
jgi:hypothetical protein